MEITQLAFALAIVLVVLFALRGVMRATGLDAGGGRSKRNIRVIESVAIGTRKRLLLVEVAGDRMLLSSCESGTSLLRVLPSEAEAAGEGVECEELEAEAAESRPIPLSQSLARGWAALGAFALCFFFAGDAQAVEINSGGLALSLDGSEGMSSSLELLALLTLVSVAPSILLMTTCFTRIVIVLAFVRQAIGVQHLPPNQVLIGLSLFLTFFVMAPLGEQIRTEAYEPYVNGSLEPEVALERGVAPLRRYMMSHTREADLALFTDLAAGQVAVDPEGDPDLRVLLPSFLISELRTAFEIGFTIFLPFLVIDLVVASMLISMGMIVLPPIVVSLPFKLMLFVLVDGWNLVLGALVAGLR